MSQQLIDLALKNPIREFLVTGETTSINQLQGLEREYTTIRPPNYTNFFKEYQYSRDDIKHIDYNKYLAMYDDYEFLYGPYVDSNKDEFALVYILHRKLHNINYVKVVYGIRVLEELKLGSKLSSDHDFSSYTKYSDQISTMPIINPNRFCAYNTHYKLSTEEKELARRIYGGSSVSNAKYNATRNMYNVGINIPGSRSLTINLARLLYEIHIAKRRLGAKEVVSMTNGKMGDVRLDNLTYKNLEDEKAQAKTEAMDKYGLDIDKLEELYSEIGYGRFRGIYTDNAKNASNSEYGRRYVKMVKPGTDDQVTIYLAAAIMCVKLNRILGTDETVDHIDKNKTNDKLENLQVIARSVHGAEDAIRLEIDQTTCVVCGKEFRPSHDNFKYYNNGGNNVLLCCTPQCQKKLAIIRKEGNLHLLHPQTIDYRYYVLNKTTRGRVYLKSKDYKEARQEVNTTHRG